MNIKSGFTMLELVIVIAIIAILSTLIVPRITSAIATARASKASYTISIIYEGVRKMIKDGYTVGDISTAVNSGNVGEIIYGATNNSDGTWQYTYEGATNIIIAEKISSPQAGSCINFNIGNGNFWGNYVPIPQ